MGATDLVRVQQAPLSMAVAAVRPSLDTGRVRDIVLVRIATAGKGMLRAELGRELFSIVGHLVAQSEWSALLDRDLGALADAGLCDVKAVTIAVTAAGSKRASMMLGLPTLSRGWDETKATRLVAKALGCDALPVRRLQALQKADGLRLMIVQEAFKLKIRGLPTPAKLRSQLATLAVSRAFGHSLPAGVDERSGISAKAGRALAGRLAHPPRDFATDSRLIAALAMEHAGALKSDLESLQIALLQRYVTRGQIVVPPPPAKRSRRVALVPQSRPSVKAVAIAEPVAAPLVAPPLTVAAMPSIRPDFESFVASVRKAAHGQAEGWPGNRKAFVSRVWCVLQVEHPEWAVTSVEFKAMLAEAHRLGTIALANADLKDQRAIGDIQASAIAYRNTIFHYVRVDD